MYLSWKHVIMVVLVLFILMNMCGSCMKEGMVNKEAMASLNYHMSEGVPGSWENRDLANNAQKVLQEEGEFVAPNESMNFFGKTPFDMKCCGSTYTSSGGLMMNGAISKGGCACMSEKQLGYLNTRGGNRTGV